MFVEDARLKNASASWPFFRGSRELSVASHQNGGFAAMPR
jgi:hypothetical protein